MTLIDDALWNDRHILCENIDCSTVGTEHIFYNTDECLRFLHLNIRSYYKNFDSFLVFLDSVRVKFDIIVLSEAWLDNDKTLTLLDDYDVHFTTNTWNRNDGVVTYVRKSLGVTVRQVRLGECNGLQLTFTLRRHNYDVLAVYRSPTMNCDLFINALDDYYGTKGQSKHFTRILIGDININLSDNNNDPTKELYLNMLYDKGLINCIDKPTRVAEHSETLIDHIFTDHWDFTSTTSAVMNTSVTDHYAVALKINLSPTDSTTNQDRHTTYIDYEVLGGLMRAQSWDHVLALRDVNDSCSTFLRTLETIKEVATKPKKNSTRLKKLKPWITVNLIKSIRQRDKLSKLVKKRPFDLQTKLLFQNFRSNLNNEIKRTKYHYYKNKIIENAGNPKCFWNIVNEFNGIKKQKTQFPIKHFLRYADASGGAVREVANSFNEYFVNVGKNLASALPPVSGPPLVDDAACGADHVFRLEPVSDAGVKQCIAELRGGSAPGVDNVSTILLKKFIDQLVRPITHIVNGSLSSGVFPNSLKIAKVIPLFKSGEKGLYSNFRPISLLSVLSKIIEKCVKKQLQYYLENNNLLTERQFGFREGKNSSDALFLLNKNIMEIVNNNEKCLVLFIDLAKAFDSLDRTVLFSKMSHIGIRAIELNWFKSYLDDRCQVVSILNNVSDVKYYEFGVVQGSNLGPLLFLIYINNIVKINISGELFLFADDTAVLFKGANWKEVFNSISRDIKIIKTWFDQNVLSMNISKTKYLPISLRKVAEPPADLKVVVHCCGDPDAARCGCQVIERVDHYKYLGVIIDSQLRWEKHITVVKSKLRKCIYIFKQLRDILNINELKMVYYAYVHSILEYGIISWGGAYRSIIEPLSVVQKAILKIILYKNYDYPTELLFKEAGLLSIRQIFIKHMLIFTKRNTDLIITSASHSYQTRSALSIGTQMPRIVKSINNTNSYYLANVLYRNIPAEIRDQQGSVIVYKKRVTAWLLGLGSEQTEDLLKSVYYNT